MKGKKSDEITTPRSIECTMKCVYGMVYSYRLIALLATVHQFSIKSYGTVSAVLFLLYAYTLFRFGSTFLCTSLNFRIDFGCLNSKRWKVHLFEYHRQLSHRRECVCICVCIALPLTARSLSTMCYRAIVLCFSISAHSKYTLKSEMVNWKDMHCHIDCSILSAGAKQSRANRVRMNNNNNGNTASQPLSQLPTFHTFRACEGEYNSHCKYVNCQRWSLF